MFVINGGKLSHLISHLYFFLWIVDLCLLSIFLCDFIKLYQVYMNINNVYIKDMYQTYLHIFFTFFLWGEL